MTWLTDVLACYRLTRLATQDTITEGLRLKVRRAALNAPDGIAPKLETLVTCPWCISAHIAVLVVAARMVIPRQWDPVARLLAFSAVTGLIAENLD